MITVSQSHGNFAVGHNIFEIRHGVAPDLALGGREHQLHAFRIHIIGPRHDGGDGLVFGQWQQVHHGLALAGGAGGGQAINFQLVDLAGGREKQHRSVGVGDENLGDKIFVPSGHSCATLTAPALGPVFRQRDPLDVAGLGHRDDHVFPFDQVFVQAIDQSVFNAGAPRGSKFFFHLHQFSPKNFHQPFAAA